MACSTPHSTFGFANLSFISSALLGERKAKGGFGDRRNRIPSLAGLHWCKLIYFNSEIFHELFKLPEGQAEAKVEVLIAVLKQCCRAQE